MGSKDSAERYAEVVDPTSSPQPAPLSKSAHDSLLYSYVALCAPSGPFSGHYAGSLRTDIDVRAKADGVLRTDTI